MSKLKKLSIENNKYVKYDIIVIDNRNKTLVFASLIDADTEIKKSVISVNRKNSIYLDSLRTYISSVPHYTIEKRKQNKSDFAHAVINKDDTIEMLDNDNELYLSYIYYKDESEILSKIYDKLYKNTAIPILEDWMQYIYSELKRNNYLTALLVDHIYNVAPFHAYKLQINKLQLLSIVQRGLQEHKITIMNTNTASPLMEEINGIDTYLNLFGEMLTDRIQNSFVPKFNPKISEYSEYVNNFDDYCYANGVELYSAQKSTVQASVNNLNINDSTLIVGEMGIGIIQF